MTQESPLRLHAGSAHSRAGEVADLLARRSREAGPDVHLGTKQSLCREIGVAPGTLNESLRMLEAQGLITMRTGPGGGVFSSEPHPLVRIGQAMVRVSDGAESVAQAAVVRNALEPVVLLDAALHRTDDDLRLLRERLRLVEDSVDDDLGFARAIWDFHRAIYAAADNELLAEVCRAMLDLITARTESVEPKTPARKRARIAGHRALLDAVEAGDPQMCRRAMELHGVDGAEVHASTGGECTDEAVNAENRRPDDPNGGSCSLVRPPGLEPGTH